MINMHLICDVASEVIPQFVRDNCSIRERYSMSSEVFGHQPNLPYNHCLLWCAAFQGWIHLDETH